LWTLRRESFLGFSLAQDFFDDAGWFDAGELLVEALVIEGELVVINSQLVKDGGVKVADVDGILGDVVAEVIGLAVNLSAFDAATGHPHREGTRVVIATVIRLGQGAL